MLLSQTFVRLLVYWDHGFFKSFPASLINQRVPVALVQILHRTLKSQLPDGSWGRLSCEPTAYAILTLLSISSLPWFEAFQSEIATAIKSGQEYLISREKHWIGPSYIWIEKVTYTIPVICQAYCIAARYGHQPPDLWTEAVRGLLPIASGNTTKLQKSFSSLPMFQSNPFRGRILSLSQIEASLLAPTLQRVKTDGFPRKENGEDKYLEYIPFIITSCNYLGSPIGTELLKELMALSVLVYQADEFMEAVVGVEFGHDLECIRNIITRACRQGTQQNSSARAENDELAPKLLSGENYTKAFSAKGVEEILQRFTDYFSSHPRVVDSPKSLRHQVSHELEKFLLAHVQQIEDNRRRLSETSNGAGPNAKAHKTYFDWVRSTSADHTSCPYSFVFWTCLISEPGRNCFANVKAKYLAQDMCRHLATMCRQYNDYGSIARDRTEGNLNSIDFAEFRSDYTPNQVTKRSRDGQLLGVGIETIRRKEDLLWIAEYERRCMELSLANLADECSEDTLNAVRFFVRVTDLYGQIYIVKDLTNKVDVNVRLQSP